MISAVKTLTALQLRIKDKHASVLSQMAREVNQVFNFCNEISRRAIRERCQWLSGYDLQKLTAGLSQCEGVKVGSGTVQLVCADYAARRKQFKKARLNWRVSNPKSSKCSLGWIPFKGGHAKYWAGQIESAGNKFSLWDSYGLGQYELRAGSFRLERTWNKAMGLRLRCVTRPRCECFEEHCRARAGASCRRSLTGRQRDQNPCTSGLEVVKATQNAAPLWQQKPDDRR